MRWKFWTSSKPNGSGVDDPATDDVEQDAADAAANEAWYEEKSALMAQALGPEHDHVVHAIISYDVGGALHSYFFGDGTTGTAVATKQLAREDGSGSSNNEYDQYECVMFTRQDLRNRDGVPPLLSGDDADDRQRMFGNIRTLLNAVAPYSEEATLNPLDTIGFPDDWEGVGGRFILLNAWRPDLFSRRFGLMLLMEIFESEFAFKSEHGSEALVERLTAAGHYPYSDLNREPVA